MLPSLVNLKCNILNFTNSGRRYHHCNFLVKQKFSKRRSIYFKEP
jgi:hypothetical protein